MAETILGTPGRGKQLCWGVPGTCRELYCNWEHQVGEATIQRMYQLLEGNYTAIVSIRYVKGVAINIR